MQAAVAGGGWSSVAERIVSRILEAPAAITAGGIDYIGRPSFRLASLKW